MNGGQNGDSGPPEITRFPMTSRGYVVVATLCALLVCLAGGSVAAAAVASQDGGVTGIQHKGPGVALEDPSMTYLWTGENYSLNLPVSSVPGENATTYVVCAEFKSTSASHDLGCTDRTLPRETTRTFELQTERWPDNVGGDGEIHVRLYAGESPAADNLVQSVSIPVHIFEKDGDLDSDGLANAQEISMGTHPAKPDSSGDGLNDGLAVMLGVDPTDPLALYKVVGGGVTLLAAVVMGSVFLSNRIFGQGGGGGSNVDPGDGASSDGGRSQGSPGSGAVGSADGDAATSPAADRPAAADFVSDEDRVVSLLRDSGGRLKQSQIVEATDWSKSKVSRLLSAMETDGELSRVQLGRENLVCLRGHEPSGSRPPWED